MGVVARGGPLRDRGLGPPGPQTQHLHLAPSSHAEVHLTGRWKRDTSGRGTGPKGKWEGRPLPTLLPLTPLPFVYHGKRTLSAPRSWYPPRPPWPSGAGATTPHPTQARVPPRAGHARNAKSRPRIHFPHFISVQLLDSPEASAAPPAPARAVRRRGPGQVGRGRRRAGGAAAVSPRLVR